MTAAELLGRSGRNRAQVAQLVGQVRGLLNEVDTSDQLRRHGLSIVGQLEANPGSHHLFYEVQIMLDGLRRTASSQVPEVVVGPEPPPSRRDLHQGALTFIVAGQDPDVAAVLNDVFGQEALNAEIDTIRARSLPQIPPAA